MRRRFFLFVFPFLLIFCAVCGNTEAPVDNPSESVSALEETESEPEIVGNEEGIETEIFWIGNKPVGGCIACKACVNNGKCVLDDVVNRFREKAYEADGFIFGSPVHYITAPGASLEYDDGHGRKIYEKNVHCPHMGIWVIAVLIAGYSIYAFIHRGIVRYMLMPDHFVFFDFDEPIVFFATDYIAVMGMLVFVGHYIAAGLKRIQKKKYIN